MKNLVVGFAGKATAGKDTLINLIKKHLPDGSYISIAFSDVLYQEVSNYFLKVDQSTLRNNETKDTPIQEMALKNCTNLGFIGFMFARHKEVSYLEPQSPRLILQLWGEYRRDIDPDYFINPVRKIISDSEDKIILISGVRVTPDRTAEVDLVRDSGGFLVHVTRNAVIEVNHNAIETEVPFEEGDVVVSNNRTIDDLESLAVGLALQLSELSNPELTY